jgi:hypothetical protein
MRHLSNFWLRTADAVFDDDYARYVDYVGRAHTARGADPNIYAVVWARAMNAGARACRADGWLASPARARHVRMAPGVARTPSCGWREQKLGRLLTCLPTRLWEGHGSGLGNPHEGVRSTR